LGRINAADTANNGLLLRNLFGGWPRENLAQIYSSGDNGDAGFFGSYYQLGPRDRRLGKLFYRLKADVQAEAVTENDVKPGSVAVPSAKSPVKKILKHLLVDSGFYEIIFRPQLSREMLAWIEKFQPEFIFAQGYSLSFAWLPVLLANHFHLPVGYYPTDDWPSETYKTDNKNDSFLSRYVSAVVFKSARRLVDVATVRLAFNRYMSEEYLKRYGRTFSVLMHGDVFSRYQAVQSRRLAAAEESWIVSTGIFNSNRRPLLDDLDQACELLSAKGIRTRATIFPVNQLPELLPEKNNFRHLSFEPCPSHEDLVAVLKGADILFLPERFDETAQGIALSVSSKAHLFMFSEKPIVVYSSPVTGIARYAKEGGWAEVVDSRNVSRLAGTLEKLVTDEAERKRLITQARSTAIKNHELTTIQSTFLRLLQNAVEK
jgi:glycosyltransferase involved in cell wall biosynthesis